MLLFDIRTVTARFIEPSGKSVEKEIEIRTNPITGRTCRVAFSRIDETEPGTDMMPEPPPGFDQTDDCPFCRPTLEEQTPMVRPEISSKGRLVEDESVLFPNLFPYGSYSAVSLFDNRHFVEIGRASKGSYFHSFLNTRNYLRRVLDVDPRAVYMAITQNHLPSAGGSLLHPHLQVNADRIASNHHRFLLKRSGEYYKTSGGYLFSDYLAHEIRDGSRYVGRTGAWEWTAAFAPEGFFEFWGICPGHVRITRCDDSVWRDLAEGVIRLQKYYRSINRNGYNLGVLVVEDPASRLELRTIMLARSNHAPWVRNDHTGFEVMLGDMTTFTAPEMIAEHARSFFSS